MNLRGGSGDTATGAWNGGTNYRERQWPCPAGYHVPSSVERMGVVQEGFTAGYWSGTRSSDITLWWNEYEFYKFRDKLKLPAAGGRVHIVPDTFWYINTSAMQSSSPVLDGVNLWFFSVAPRSVSLWGYSRSRGFSLRCFADSDNVSPVLTLKGNTNLTLTLYSLFVDEGATWEDNYDGTGIVYASGTVGDYLLEYRYIDTFSNTGNIVYRTVHIVNAQWGGSISLKKDDCPSGDFSSSYYDKTCWTTADLEEEVAKKVNVLRPLRARIYLIGNGKWETFIFDLITSCSQTNKNEVIKLACQELVGHWNF
jgi:hypothetical protein